MNLHAQMLLKERIKVEGFGEIPNLMLSKVLEEGEEKVTTYVAAISFRKIDIKEIYKNENYNKLNDFDVIMMLNDFEFKKVLTDAISFFTDEDVYINKDVHMISVGKHQTLTRENYHMFVEIVVEMTNLRRGKPEWTKYEKMSESQKEVSKKFDMHRARKQKESQLQFIDILNIVKHGAGFLNRKELLNMTYYEFLKYFEMILAQDSYREFLTYKTSANFKVETNVDHWTKKIRQRSENNELFD